MSSADFEKWCKQKVWTVGEAAMLSLGLEPTGDYPPRIDPPQLNRLYHDIIAAAQSDLGGKLPTKWESSTPVIPATRAFPIYVNVLPGDWIDWATSAGLPIPTAIEKQRMNLTRSRPPSAKQRREFEFEQLLGDVASRFLEKRERFDRTRMPGSRAQFYDLIRRACPTLAHLSSNDSFDKYFKLYELKFISGRRKASNTSPWPKRFPEFFS